MMRRLLFALVLTFALAHPVHAQQLIAPAKPAEAPVPTELDKQLASVTSVPELERAASKFASQGDLKSLASVINRLVALRPGNGNYLYTLAATYAQQGMKRETYDILVRLQTSGYAFDPTDDKRFEKVHGTEVWDYLLLNLKANAKPFGEGKVAHALPAGDYLFETLAWDPKRKQLLVGSAREGKVYRVGPNGALEPFIAADASNGMWAVMDIAVDAPRNAVYVASSAIPHFKGVDTADYGKSAVFKFSLDTGKFEKKFAVDLPPGGKVNLSAIAVTPSGRVFAADGIARGLFRLEGDVLKVFLANKALTSIQVMTASEDALYFADYELGIFGIDQKTGEPFEVMIPPTLTLYGITGLSYWNGHLVATQTGFPPQRIMRFKLTPDGRKIENSQPLAAAQPEFTALARGVVAGDSYFVIANSQKAKYDRYGLPRTGETLEGVKIFEANTKFALDGDGLQQRPAVIAPPGD